MVPLIRISILLAVKKIHRCLLKGRATHPLTLSRIPSSNFIQSKGKRITEIISRICVLILAALLFSTNIPASTEDCQTEPEFFRYLSGKIGAGNLDAPSVYLLPCDTMIVNNGVTVQVSPNTYLAFADPKPENTIVIKGTLISQGQPTAQVRISSTLDTVLFSPEDMKSPWKGLKVEESGNLILENTSVFGASIPIVVYSDKLRMFNTFLYQAVQITVDKKENIPIGKDNYFKSFTLSDYFQGKKEKTTILESPAPAVVVQEKSVWQSPWWYATLFIVGGGGAAGSLLWFSLQDDPKTDDAEKAFLATKPKLPNP